MSVVKKIVCLGMLLLGLTGCSSRYASNENTNYLNSKNGQNLVIPPSLTSSNLGYFYNLPAQEQKAKVSIKPPTV